MGIPQETDRTRRSFATGKPRGPRPCRNGHHAGPFVRQTEDFEAGMDRLFRQCGYTGPLLPHWDCLACGSTLSARSLRRAA